MKTKSTQQWGRDTAKERYSQSSPSEGGKSDGEPKNAIVGLINQPELNETGRVMQAPQSVNDKHCANYDNDTPADWLRGMGSKQAEGKPSFDKRHKA